MEPLVATCVGLFFAFFVGLFPGSTSPPSMLTTASSPSRSSTSRRSLPANARPGSASSAASSSAPDANRDEIAALRSYLTEIVAAEVELKTTVTEVEREVGQRDDMIEFLIPAGGSEGISMVLKSKPGFGS